MAERLHCTVEGKALMVNELILTTVITIDGTSATGVSFSHKTGNLQVLILSTKECNVLIFTS